MPGLDLEAPDRSVETYRVGQRVFGRHGATREYFDGYVVAIEAEHVFPYSVDVGAEQPLRILAGEIESDLPERGASWDELVAWLMP